MPETRDTVIGSPRTRLKVDIPIEAVWHDSLNATVEVKRVTIRSPWLFPRSVRRERIRRRGIVWPTNEPKVSDLFGTLVGDPEQRLWLIGYLYLDSELVVVVFYEQGPHLLVGDVQR